LGDLTVNSGGTFDMRQSGGAIGSVGRVVFSGSSNSTINLALTAYTSGTEEFNSVAINKTGGAKVILNSGNLFISNNSTNLPDTLTFISGMVETGSNRLVHLGTAGASVTGSNSTRYVNGFFGRGMSTSAGANRYFDVGDANGFRPISVRSTKLDSSGGYVAVRVISGDANNSSSFAGGIDQVSSVRYYEIIQVKGTSNTNHITVDLFAPSYGVDDNIVGGSTDLRVSPIQRTIVIHVEQYGTNYNAYDRPLFAAENDHSGCPFKCDRPNGRWVIGVCCTRQCSTAELRSPLNSPLSPPRSRTAVRNCNGSQPVK
jgi:hypothetical protein